MKYYFKKVLARRYGGLHLYGCCLWFAGLHQSGTDSGYPGLLDGDLRAFTIRIILLLLTWLAVVFCLVAETFFQAGPCAG